MSSWNRDVKNISTPNDYALEYRDSFGNRVQVMVCKYQTGPDWVATKATTFGDRPGAWTAYDKLTELTANCYSNAVAHLNGYVQSEIVRIADFKKRIAAEEANPT